MDGWTFRRQQSGDPGIANIPVVIVSAAPRELLTSVHAAAVVPKPFEYHSLIATLRQHC